MMAIRRPALILGDPTLLVRPKRCRRVAVLDVLRIPSLSLDPKLPEFESALAEYVGCGHAVAVNSGSSALHLIVPALGDRGEG